MAAEQQTITGLNAGDRFRLGLASQTQEGRNKILAFWFFLGGESILFASLFATYLVLRHQTGSGPTAQDLFGFGLVFILTFLLITSSLTSIFAVNGMERQDRKATALWLGVTIALGLGFLLLQIYEFVHYVHEGLGYRTSAFASSFYTLVGFHGFHVAFGLCWLTAVTVQVVRHGVTPVNAPKVFISTLYWHFVDVVWMFIFTVVYLMGILGV